MNSQHHDTNNETGRILRVTRISRLLQLLAIVMLLGVMVPEAQAVTHGLCNGCGEFVVIRQGGAGLNRHWKGFCGTCKAHGVLKEFTRPTKPVKPALPQLELRGVELQNSGRGNAATSTPVIVEEVVLLAPETVEVAKESAESFWGGAIRRIFLVPFTHGVLP